MTLKILSTIVILALGTYAIYEKLSEQIQNNSLYQYKSNSLYQYKRIIDFYRDPESEYIDSAGDFNSMDLMVICEREPSRCEGGTF